MYSKSLIVFAVLCGLLNTLSAGDAAPEALHKGTQSKDAPPAIPPPARVARKTVVREEPKVETAVDAKNGRFQFVSESNMPSWMIDDLLFYIDTSYSYSNDMLLISQFIQNFFDTYYPDYSWNAIMNYEAASFYHYYYAVVRRNSDTILVYG